MTRRTKKVVIKEELVELTGDYKLAIVLNQMIYWSERVSDFDKFIAEEKGRLSTENVDSTSLEYQNGWIYKTAEDLADECMITNSEATMRRYLDKLISSGWLSARRNPKYKWDKTMQYRVNITAIQKALFVMGFVLDGYRIDFEITKNTNDDSNFQNDESGFQNENSDFQNDDSIFHGDDSNFHGERAIPEITTEITTNKREEEKEAPARDPLITFFEANGFGTISPYIGEKMDAWCKDLSENLVLEAMKIAVEYGAKNWTYVDRILRNWAEKKYTSVEQVHSALLAFREQKAKQQNRPRKNGKPIRTEIIPEWFNESKPELETPNVPSDAAAKKKAFEDKLKKLRKQEN
ncbi:DnaD domain protein [Neobacillus sp. MM2021_6]|uniref:DnaD domain-containing protein n=1 Tax=Bacillaceae TaxID=186817 RepID=UPI001407EDC4|nr:MULTISPECIES: DnaD domain protein [Bacillaceae]MBO0962522.1 DnaD domain protein [Neobacillus sp. MM2021_6]NHC21000.1 DnaD domain protein [Bacillus sp. MM2020_4]